jgi:hypothetical protein
MNIDQDEGALFGSGSRLRSSHAAIAAKST